MDNINLNRENGQKLWAADWNKLISTINLIIDAVNNQSNLPGITKLSQLINDSGFITQEDVKGKVNKGELAEVATSGSYNDLKDKPSQMTGPQGPEGKSAYQVAVLNGFIGTPQLWLDSLKGEDGLPGLDGENGLDGQDGLNGSDGKSAYELAVEEGYEGTLELWLESLLGVDGTNGANGKSAYQSYLDTTTDDPPLTEEQWSANTSNGSSRFTDTNEEIVYNVNSNNHDYVDLCLPSGTLWSTMNLGASSVLEEGLFFTLGGLQGYSLQEAVGHTLYPYYNNDSITSLPIEYDSARHLWAGEWEMPTKKQIEELLRYTTQEIVLIEGVNVLKLTSKSNLLKYIYFPLSQSSIGIQLDNNTYKLSGISSLSHDLWVKDGIYYLELTDYIRSYGTSWLYAKGYEKGFWDDSDLRSMLHHIRPIINNLNGYHRRLQEICFSGSYNDLFDIPTISYKELTNTPKKVSLFENDNLYLTYTSVENRYLTVPEALVTSYRNSHDYYNICGTFWSRYDIGEDSTHDQGMLFRLGDPTGHYPSENFLFTELSYREYISQINSDRYYSIVSELNVFNPVSQNFGSHWHYPTEEDIKNLYTYSKAKKLSNHLNFSSLKYGNLIIYFNLTDSDSVTMRIKGGLVIMKESGYTIRKYKYSDSIGSDYFQNLTKECYGGYIIRPILYLPKKVSMIGITGDYNDLINQPTIPAAQIQADWNQTDNTALDYIKNKPTIPSSSGTQIQADWNLTDNTLADYIKNKPSIPNAPILSNWNETDTSSLAYIANKPTIPAALVLSDWNASTGMGAILNKPIIPTVPANETATLGGTTLSVVTTGDKYNWNNKANVWQGTQAQYDALSPNYDSNTIYIITES